MYHGSEEGIDRFILRVENPILAKSYWKIMQNPTKKHDLPNPATSLVKNFSIKYFLYFLLGLIVAIVFTVLSINEWNRMLKMEYKSVALGFYIFLGIIGLIFFIRSFFGMYNVGMLDFLRPEMYKIYHEEKKFNDTVISEAMKREQATIERYEKYRNGFATRQAKLKDEAKKIEKQIKDITILPIELKPHAPEIYEYFLNHKYKGANVVDALYTKVNDIRKQEKEQAQKEFQERIEMRQREEAAREIRKQEERDETMRKILEKLNEISKK